MKELISIIVPCYNQAQYLDECLQSVYSQTYADWECIIINDGSPDNTEDIAKKWQEKDVRFKYYRIENSGVSSARNFGINKAKGKWILPLDGDDMIGKNYLLFAEKEMQNNSTIIYCKAQYFGEKTGEFVLPSFTKYELLYSNKIFCTAFFKKEFWEKIQGYDEKMKDGYEDWEFWIRVIFNKNFKIKIKKLNYVGFFYRIKRVSRNAVAKKNKHIEIKKYVYQKHLEIYQSTTSYYDTSVFEKMNIIVEKIKNILLNPSRIVNYINKRQKN